MRRFYCQSKDIHKNYIYLKDKQEIHHIKNVLRLKPDDRIALFSDDSCEHEGLIKQVKPRCISVKIQGIKPKFLQVDAKIAQPQISLTCAIPKRAKIDDIIDKLTQLGVDRIIT